MSDKKIYVTSPSLPPLEEYVEEISSIWETGIMTHTGPKHVELQKQLEGYFSVENVALFANGHLALELGLEALEVTGEVITTPFTFASTTQAILRRGLKPVFCDVEPEFYTMDCDKIEDLITDKTTAILPVHVYGNICDVERIQGIADKHHLKVLYDAAHAFGESYKGTNVSRLGDMSMFSFHATKVFNTVEGGCLTFADSSKVQLLNGLRQFGQIVGTEVTPYIGTNAKMTEMHAAMGLCNLKHMDEYIEKRGRVMGRYRDRLKNVDGIKLCPVQEHVKSNYAYFPVVFEESKSGVTRQMVLDKLAENNIFARKYFYPLTSDFECCQEMGLKADVPNARYLSDRVLTLPCYSELALEDVDRICDCVLQLYQGLRR